eukprot:SAG31_NODE_23248_length_508_cov_0.748166_2_plen_47_part_01
MHLHCGSATTRFRVGMQAATVHVSENESVAAGRDAYSMTFYLFKNCR